MKKITTQLGEALKKLGDKSWTQKEEERYQQDLKKHLTEKIRTRVSIKQAREEVRKQMYMTEQATNGVL